jgi:hypothetical protein
MMFFKIAGVALGVIALLNIIQVSVELAMRDGVYACSDLRKYDPIDVQKKCRRYK